MMPHMHLRGKDFRFTIRYPDGRDDDQILNVPRYDFNWQLGYELAKPVHLAAGGGRPGVNSGAKSSGVDAVMVFLVNHDS